MNTVDIKYNWIDVNDALPQNEDYVLVCRRHTFAGDTESIYWKELALYCQGRGWVMKIESDGRYPVTHWVALPDLPDACK